MANEFTRNVGSQIPKAEAIKWIDKFKKERKKDTESVFYGADAIEAILALPGCTGISFMFVRKYDDKQKKDIDDIVMVGRKEDGTLLWTDDAPSLTALDRGSQTYDFGKTCPPDC